MRPVVSFLNSMKYIRSYIFSCGRSHCGCWSYQQKSCNEKEFADGISHADLDCANPDVVRWACKFEVWEAFDYALLGGSSACLLCCVMEATLGKKLLRTSCRTCSSVQYNHPINRTYVLWLQLSRWVCVNVFSVLQRRQSLSYKSRYATVQRSSRINRPTLVSSLWINLVSAENMIAISI